MKLIGAGLPRTATLSQKVALEMLGFGPCYHMVDVLSDLDRVRPWSDALSGNANWHEIFDGFESTVDWPGSFHYRELIETYPDAKVLLSVRSGESWARSMNDTICALHYGDTMMHDLSSARARIDPHWRAFVDLMKEMLSASGLLADGNGSGTTALAEAMERHNDEVREASGDVLVWSPADGWEPLCAFLEVPVPDVPFPRTNDGAVFAERIVDSAIDALNEWRAQQGRPAEG
ncbi:MAG TPA: sulfotransferase [Gaiellaceae bacterium]|nr:sulfotransferase [Gaiellaceae bacterium]